MSTPKPYLDMGTSPYMWVSPHNGAKCCLDTEPLLSRHRKNSSTPKKPLLLSRHRKNPSHVTSTPSLVTSTPRLSTTLRRRTKPLVAAKPNGPLWIAEDLFGDDRALLVDDDAVAPLSGDNQLSTALVDYLLQRSLQPTDLQDTTLVGSANSLHFFHQVNAKIATAPSDPNVAKSVENIRQRCSHYKDNKFEFLSPFCIYHHFVAVKIVFDLRSPDIFHEVSVYDSLIKGGRRNNSVHRNSPPAKYLRPFQQFIANFCLFGNPKCEVLLANPDHIVEKAVYRSCPMQQNGFDCGLFAFGCVLHLLKGLDVSADIFNQQHISKLRESLHAVFTVTDIGSDVPNPRELLSSSFLSSFFPLQSENDCHDDVFLRLLQDLPTNDNDIDAAPDVPDKGPPIELEVVPLHPRLGADPQPEPTRHRDNYFTTQFIAAPRHLSWDHAALFAACEACPVSRWGVPLVKMEGNPVHCFGADRVQ
ncbi:hypothetical protein IV203_008280 [Nitzschia inconspicua]|uniref:Uncharacterized protein n=1 Tax=Nitzschia inconspicua TaxID=303405 RepID=A0A9K3KYJ5_9STRA|nr:hypothetical protein IV203_008280 [Nitzschia inconspicua]